MNNLKICLLGYGNVGRGFYRLVEEMNDENIQIIKVFEREKKRALLGDLFVGSIDEMVNNKDINVVVECIGGDDIAYEAITKSLKAGKSVITSNKATVSIHLDEYLLLAKQNGCHFKFEASVGGGVPLINTMQHILSYDKIISFYGLINGTTNYIITRVMDDYVDFDKALKEAQEKGFAEADPSSDLMGIDMVRKGAILSSIAYGVKINVDEIPHFGIENLTNEIVADVRKMNKTMKLSVSSFYSDGKLSLGVIPLLISPENTLNGVKYEFNGVSLYCKNNDVITLVGKGAGGIPTGCAIMQDINDLLNDKEDIKRNEVKKVKNKFTFDGMFYIVTPRGKNLIQNPTSLDLQDVKFIAKVI